MIFWVSSLFSQETFAICDINMLNFSFIFNLSLFQPGIMTTHVLYILKSNISNLPVPLFRLWQPASIHNITSSIVQAAVSVISNMSLFQSGNHNNSCFHTYLNLIISSCLFRCSSCGSLPAYIMFPVPLFQPQ